MTRREIRASALALGVLVGCGTAGADSAPADGVVMTRTETKARSTVAAAERYVGVLLPEVAVEIAPPTLVEVVDVLVAPGDIVAMGQPLATIDGRAAKEELAIAKAELRQREAIAAEIGTQVSQSKVIVARLNRLAGQGHASQEELEAARFTEQRTRSSRASALAAIAETRARIDKIVRQLDDTSLRAPFSGTVATRHRNAGAVAGPDAPILRIVGGRTLCRFGVPAPADAEFSPGARVEIRSESGDASAVAVVLRRAPEVDTAARLVFVDAVLDRDATDGWAIGTAVRVERLD
jgi:RND family efflux transporter MFP subunit